MYEISHNETNSLYHREINLESGMIYKFTYGKPGDSWESSEEWSGSPNRTPNQESTLLYEDQYGEKWAVHVFGVRFSLKECIPEPSGEEESPTESDP
jgi:hypothetical protein